MEERIKTVSGVDAVTGEPVTTVHKEVIRTSIDTTREDELRHKANANLLMGIAMGAVLAIGSMMFFANEQGSFAVAGATVDRSIDEAAEDARDITTEAANSVGDAARTTGEAIDETLSTDGSSSSR